MNTISARGINTVRGLLASAVLAGFLTGLAAPALAAPGDDRILPVDQYTSDKARRLATTHARALQGLHTAVYHCLPWLEIQKQSIGFFRPKGASQDERYLSIRVYIEQDPSPQFAQLRIEQRSAAMFSRYVGPLLTRMAADRSLLNDASLDGFTVILEWLKQDPGKGQRPVHETIAIFLPKSAAVDYVAGRASVGRLADVARVLAWDGETSVGALRLTAWDDNFVSTYKVANYQLAPGVTCQ
jgi:hypothetical protein